jgi:hypothetical protein
MARASSFVIARTWVQPQFGTQMKSPSGRYSRIFRPLSPSSHPWLSINILSQFTAAPPAHPIPVLLRIS